MPERIDAKHLGVAVFERTKKCRGQILLHTLHTHLVEDFLSGRRDFKGLFLTQFVQGDIHTLRGLETKQVKEGLARDKIFLLAKGKFQQVAVLILKRLGGVELDLAGYKLQAGVGNKVFHMTRATLGDIFF